MGFFFKTLITFLFIATYTLNSQAQENQTNKPPSLQRNAPAASLNVGAAKLKENLFYKVDPNTHIGINGLKFGLKINF